MAEVKNNQYLIDEIKKKHSIIEYLDSRGIYPQRKFAGRTSYLCPIHENDTKPSFVVYDGDGEGQNYFCYGCRHSGTIINLVSVIEKISFKETLKRLSDGIIINDKA